MNAHECTCIFYCCYWKLIHANDATWGVDEIAMHAIDSTTGTNKCTFSINEQQKVYWFDLPVWHNLQKSI